MGGRSPAGAWRGPGGRGRVARTRVAQCTSTHHTSVTGGLLTIACRHAQGFARIHTARSAGLWRSALRLICGLDAVIARAGAEDPRLAGELPVAACLCVGRSHYVAHRE